MIRIRSIVPAAAAAVPMLLSAGASADILFPGDTLLCDGGNQFSSPWLVGFTAGNVTRNFEIRDSNDEVVFTGRLHMYIMENTGPVVRRYVNYRLQNLNGVGDRAVSAINLTGFGDSAIDAERRNDWEEGEHPAAIVRSVDGDMVTAQFPELVSPGRQTSFIYLFTDAQVLEPNGTAEIVLNTNERVTLTHLPVPPRRPAPCAGDANGDGVITFADLNALLSEFGDACD